MNRKSKLLELFISNGITAEQLVDMVVALELEVEHYRATAQNCECDQY